MACPEAEGGWGMKRDYTAGLEKVREEGACRVCGTSSVKLDCAHVVPRSRLSPGPAEDPRNLVPLCAVQCHPAYDQGRLDLLPHLSRDEQAYAVELVGLEEARRYLTNERNDRVA
jgi:hypothetical protein